MSSTTTATASQSTAPAGRRPRVCMLTQYWPPEMGAPQGMLSELGERLIDRGWEVEVLTALPNYPTGKVFAGYDPDKPCEEMIGRIRSVRVPLYTIKTRGFIKRLRSFLSFSFSAKKFGPQMCNRPDILFVHSPPLFIGIGGMALAKKWKCPFLFNVCDLWPETAIHIGIVKPGLLTWLTEKLELKLYRRAAGVTGQSKGICASIRQRVPSAKVELLSHGVEPERFGKKFADDEARKLLGDEPGPIFIFAGLMGLAQGLDQILDIAASMPADMPGRFVLVGDGPAREGLEARLAHEKIPRVKMLPSQPRERVPALLAASDVALISLGMSIPGALPCKIFEAMASELPILLIADGEPARTVTEADAGIAVDPGDLAAARDAVCRLASDPALRDRFAPGGRKASETTYNRDYQAQILDNFMRSLLPK